LLATKAVDHYRGIAVTGTNALTEQLKDGVAVSADHLRAAGQELVKYQNEQPVEILRNDADAMLSERGDLLRLELDIETEKAKLASAQEQIKKEPPVLLVPASTLGDAASTRSGHLEPADPQRADVARAVVNPAYQTLATQIAASHTLIAGLERRRHQLRQFRQGGGVRYVKFNELHRRMMETARLQTEYDVANQVYTELAKRYQQSRIPISGIVQIVEPATPPATPIPRRRLQSTVLGLTSGLLFAGLAVPLLSYRKRPSGSPAT
jgi:uncharacterized protein involved in exopolysaccharide biosynthesis